jgi:alpha-ketoglutarate-dependent taurine dioxygenase
MELADRLGKLTGKPSSSGLHIHPISNFGREQHGDDYEINIISSVGRKVLYTGEFGEKKQNTKENWHSDISFEPIPSDYATLRLTELPGTGGGKNYSLCKISWTENYFLFLFASHLEFYDLTWWHEHPDTLWASGYELYDRLSTPYQKFLDGLTATYAQPKFGVAAKKASFEIYSATRGCPENVGEELRAVHPVVRTNPVTGWKSIFAFGHHTEKINDLTALESSKLMEWFLDLVVGNHDMQVRHRWQNANDVAIWDNRSVYHAATPDFEGLGERVGHRAVSLGEKPYFDPQSTSRREGLRNAALQKETIAHSWAAMSRAWHSSSGWDVCLVIVYY